MSSQNKGLKLAVLSLIGLFGLTSCGESSEIYSKPINYDEPIVTIDGNKDIHHNVLSIIYDAIHEGSLSSKVLDNALYRYASSVFGYYNNITLPVLPDGATKPITLKEAFNDTSADHEAINAFIKEHKAYWLYNDDGEHIDAQGNVIKDGDEWTPSEAERKHVISKWNAIETRIAETLYGRISGGSYTEKNYFNESKLLKALYQDGKKVKYDDLTDHLERFIIPYTLEKADVFDELVGYDGANHTVLHREFYQSSVTEANENIQTTKYTYVEDELLPEIYNDLLIEQYLLDEDVAAVRNSRARKINVIKIPKYSTFLLNAKKLVESLVQDIYKLPEASESYLRTDADVIEDWGRDLFETYEIVSKGLYDQIQGDAAAKEIVESLQASASDIYEVATGKDGVTKYYKHTTFGDIVEDYDEISTVTDWSLLNTSKYSTFTANGTRTIEEGFEQQKIDVMQTKNITKGWYIQSQTPTLDSNGAINENLFKLSIANAKIELTAPTDSAYEDLVEADRIVKENNVWKVRDEKSEKENKFLCSINGSYFLKFDGKSSQDSWTDDIVYDDGDAYYIVQVLEAAKDSKLRNSSASNYATTRGQEFMDSVVDEIAKLVGSTGSYSTLSKNHWLEKMDLLYHDQEVYDYFKSNYPDLFED